MPPSGCGITTGWLHHRRKALLTDHVLALCDVKKLGVTIIINVGAKHRLNSATESLQTW